MTASYSIAPIGYVRSEFKERRAIPLQGGRAILELDPLLAEGLDGLENSSHLIVMGFLHLADRTVLKSHPVMVDPHAPAKGVFSTRSPARPNPISVTVVPLLGRAAMRLEVDRLDLVDGTPIVDLKSYCPGWDGVFCAQHKHRAGPTAVNDARLAACMERDLENFMGPVARGASARWGLGAAFVAARRLEIDPRDPLLRVSVNRVDETTEALMALTGAAFSNQRLKARAEAQPLQMRFERCGRNLELRATAAELPAAVPEWAAAFAVAEERG
ncbi:MAG: tRNA (N6-threonylcarbamoyladenosine(37)-N6)-methyltransferase TrmO [Myxococcales bacterium]